MRFTAQEFRSAAQACRARAQIARRDAENQSNPTIVKGFNEDAQRFEDLAQKFELAAKWL